jgi:threonine/homoserine/homoserine lactone efflux protein
MFGLTLMLAQASPGPTTTALVSRVVARGHGGIAYFCAGLMLGELCWLFAAMFGLAAVVEHAQQLFLLIRIVGAGYLIYLALGLWMSDGELGEHRGVEGTKNDLAIAGLAVALGNPKTMLLYLAIVPALIPVGRTSMTEFALIGSLVVSIYATVLGSYILMATQLRQILNSQRSVQLVNRACALVLFCTATFIILRT